MGVKITNPIRHFTPKFDVKDTSKTDDVSPQPAGADQWGRQTKNYPTLVNIEIRPVMYLALSYDHRIVDGKEAVSFLKIVKESLEQLKELLEVEHDENVRNVAKLAIKQIDK